MGNGKCTCTCLLLSTLALTFLYSAECEEFTKCTAKLDIEIVDEECSPLTTEKFRTKQCLQTELCRVGYNLSHIAHKPYSHLIIADLIATCCGQCPAQTRIVTNISKTSEIDETRMETTNFVFPILGRKGAVKLYGYRFLPIFETPSLYLVTLRRENIMGRILLSCLKMYPMMIICMLMVMISGFLCWFIERNGNEGQFFSCKTSSSQRFDSMKEEIHKRA